nr:MAG TPA: hypothetical protein [Caudoviricetes sp.]
MGASPDFGDCAVEPPPLASRVLERFGAVPIWLVIKRFASTGPKGDVALWALSGSANPACMRR